MDTVTIAHVADVITEIIDIDTDYRTDVDFDAVADQAAGLLGRHPELAETVDAWNAGTVTWDDLVSAVRSRLADA